MTYAPACRFAIGALFSLALGSLALGGGCAGAVTGTGTGGSSATGGSGATGGSSTGGSVGTGGTNAGTGGGVSNTGGSVGTGGTGTGGTVVSTGGSPGTGGGTGGSGTGGTTTGTAGAAGSGATGGAGGGAAGASGVGGVGGAVFFSDDFESDTMGKQPAGFDNYIAYNYNTTNPQSDGTGAVADNTHVHSGKLAVHFKATGGNPFLLERPLPTGTNHLFMRVFVYSTVQLGDGPSSDNHETLLGITEDPTSVNTQVRFGMIKGAIGTNEVPSDNIAPIMAKWNMPPIISANAWHCIEVEFDGSAAYNTLKAYSDGTLVHSIAAATDWQNGALPATWMSGMFVDVMLGWQSFSSTAADVWMDDLVLATSGPIGCN